MEIFNIVLLVIPYIFIMFHVISAIRAKAEITEIKHTLYVIMWLVVSIGDRLV
jgi:hypothetical protein